MNFIYIFFGIKYKIFLYFFFRDNYDKPDINYMMYSKVNNLLYVGCGDNNIYVINLEDRKILRSMQGHTDYIHCLAIM